MKRFFLLTLALVGCMLLGLQKSVSSRQEPSLPYKNPSLPVDKRVEDLVSRMTLEEKVSQMMNAAPPIERLGIPEYEWWNEALHGVARAGYATVFPQAIGLAATWDTSLMRDVADVISTEARAKHNEFLRNNQHARYQGLTFWSPNINIFRDPRWGRGQETYGEDPYLTSMLGVAFVKGLQGDDPRYLKVVATPKHYAVHSGPEPERHGFDAKVSERDLRETYLPAFRATIVEARAGSVMCAYNRTNTEPCCANKELMIDILRKEWGFDGYVVSDCGGITDIWKGHHFAGSEAEASALSVKAGTDLACGREYGALIEAVNSGLIGEREIDISLKRLMTARFRLGMFDPPEMVRYARIPFSENDSLAHRDLALKAARESIVLLKNENNTLPLKKSVKTLAVIGPNADAPEVLVGNYSGRPSKSVTPLAGIRNAVSGETKVLYALGATLSGEAAVPVPSSALTVNGAGTQPGFRGEYFNNQELQGQAATVRIDPQINFDWGRYKPTPQVGENNFSVRWTGKLTPPETGPYQLGATADDGVRLYLDGKLLIDAWASNPTKTVTREVNLEAGRDYDVRMEYYQYNRESIARLVWSYPHIVEKQIEEAVNAVRRADAAVVVLGLSAGLEGEEMTVSTEGFRGGDRTDISLPRGQEALLKAVSATGKPVVLLLLNGSALAVNWASVNVPAIVEAWYPGEEGGTAIADVLFGGYNPGGRLPVTFYESVAQLPPFADYDMQGRTYRYFKGVPLYPFGFGLSYTTFKYENLKLSARKIRAGEGVSVSVTVRNSGDVAGDEVVQMYVTDPSASVPVPIRSLAGVERVFLRPGEKRIVRFTLSAAKMSLINTRGKRVVEPGEFLISVGGKQPGFTGRADAITTGVLRARLVARRRRRLDSLRYHRRRRLAEK
jgi:beta-glucosidase